MKDRIDAQARAGRHGDAGDGMRDPTRRGQERAGKLAALRRDLDEAEAGGVSPRSAGEILAEARAAARTRGLPD